MVDVDQRVSIEPRNLGPRRVAALEQHRRIGRHVNAVRDLNAVDAWERVVIGRHGVVECDGHGLAERFKGEAQGHRGPNRVAIRPGVGREQKGLPGSECCCDFGSRTGHERPPLPDSPGESSGVSGAAVPAGSAPLSAASRSRRSLARSSRMRSMRSCCSTPAVEFEDEFGHTAQPHPAANLAAQKRYRTLERARGLAAWPGHRR